VPILLLAQGDPAARDLLKKTILARYGVRPPVLESLQINFKGRARAKVGPVSMWVPVEAMGYFRFPDAMRWDFIVKAAGVQLNSSTEAYDGSSYRNTRTTASLSAAQFSHSMQSRLWAIAAALLTPLGDDYVRLQAGGDFHFKALNTRINSVVDCSVRSNQTLESACVHCLNPDTGEEQLFTIRLSEALQSFDELILPQQMTAYWGEDAFFEIEPVSAEANPTFAESTFAIANK
jgi:hypothetical protein